VELWMVGIGLSALLVVAARDVARPGRSSAGALLCLRAVGGLGLGAMALVALRSGAPAAALIAMLGAVPLLAPLGRAAAGSRRATQPEAVGRAAMAATGSRHDEAEPAEERRAA
jgi:predicted lipid-binding transport protein (Tim44 family)